MALRGAIDVSTYILPFSSSRVLRWACTMHNADSSLTEDKMEYMKHLPPPCSYNIQAGESAHRRIESRVYFLHALCLCICVHRPLELPEMFMSHMVRRSDIDAAG